jgi:ATP-dependent RNA helicase DDX5/DBP2
MSHYGGGGGGYRGDRDRYDDRSGYRGGGGGGYGGGSGGGRYGHSDRDRDRGGFGNGGFGGGKLDKNIQWDLSKLPVFEKNFYIEHPAVSARSEDDAAAWRRGEVINVVGDGIPKPVMTFEEASMPEYVLTEVLKQGFQKPSPIQSQGWPMALLGRDMIGISATGSGKTLAFLLPAMIHINAQPFLEQGDGPIVLMLAPTRELAVQIKGECDKFGASSQIKNTVVYGGHPKHQQQRELRRTPEILIGTPGRLIDHIECGNTNLRRVTYLVLDEADRMLEMGFKEQMQTIVSQIRPDRQTLMWSATWPPEVQNISREFQNNPYEVHVGSMELRANKDIKQVVEVCTDYDKYPSLLKHLKEFDKDDRILIFVETKKGCDALTNSLRDEKFYARCIHGDKSQQDRDRTLQDFRTGRSPVLVATDVASRGLDIKGVKGVVNFDMPKTVEDYVHRIGRSGRAGAAGYSVSFFTQTNAGMARDLVKIMKEADQEVPRELDDMAHRGGRGAKKWNPYARNGGGGRGRW